MSHRLPLPLLLLLAFCFLCLHGIELSAAELLIGGAAVSITPKEPVALSGQMRTRIAREVESPCTATAVAIESRAEGAAGDQAIMISCDLVAIREGILEGVREKLRGRLNGFDERKLFLSATHTHTAPVMLDGRYTLPDEGVMQPSVYRAFLIDQLANAAEQAWKGRKPGRVSWGLGHAVVAQNRRAVYFDKTAQMYGKTNRPDFLGIEGYEDHGVEVLFFWNDEDALIATAINVACPAQEVEGRSAVNADFWHPVREIIQERHGKETLVLGWIGAAGDQSPHLMFRHAAEERMRKLRGVDRLEELAQRIVAAWEEAYDGAKQEIHRDVSFAHTVETIELPRRLVTEQEHAHAKKEFERLSQDPANVWRARWENAVLERYAAQQAGTEQPYEMELHVLRIGDVAIATNAFELFTEYGIRMKSRSPALQTFVVQLTGPGSYLPTQAAVAGGGYSAIVESSQVGPEGGDALVDVTVEAIEALWEKPR